MNELNIFQQLCIISQQAHAEYQAFLMWTCIGAFAIGFAAAILYVCKDGITKLCKLLKFLGPIGCVMVLPCLAKLYVYGSTKPPQPPPHLWQFVYENGLHDIGSYCSNDTIHAAWDYAPAFEGAPLMAMYQDLTLTNEVGVCIDTYHPLESTWVSNMQADWYVPNAENMRVIVWAEFVEPPEVHTNGVLKLPGVMRSIDGSDKFIPASIVIYANLDDGTRETLTPTDEPPQANLLQALAEELDINTPEEE